MQQGKHNRDQDYLILYQSLVENVIFVDNRNSLTPIFTRTRVSDTDKIQLNRLIESGSSIYITFYMCFFFTRVICRFYDMSFQIALAFKVNSVV